MEQEKMIGRRLSSGEPRGQVHECKRSGEALLFVVVFHRLKVVFLLLLFSCSPLINDLSGTAMITNRSQILGKRGETSTLITVPFLIHFEDRNSLWGGVMGHPLEIMVSVHLLLTCLLQLNKEVDKVFTSDEAQSCSPMKVLSGLIFEISRRVTLLSQPPTHPNPDPASFLCPDLLREKVWTRGGPAHHPLLLYRLLSKLELAVLQLSS